MYSYIGTYIYHVSPNYNEYIALISTGHLPDDCSPTVRDSLFRPLAPKLDRDQYLQTSNYHSTDREANTNNTCIDPEQPPVQTKIYGTAHLDYNLPIKSFRGGNFDMLDVEIHRV